MATFQFNLREPFYTAMFNRRKIYEIRANDAKRQAVRPGDVIEFHCSNKPILKTIVVTRINYPDLQTAINSVSADELQASLEHYTAIPGFTEKIGEVGAVLFQIDLHPDEKRYKVFH